jgi:hypothetical protein
MTTITTRTVTVDGIGPVEVTVTERGQGRPFLLLHGGGGPQTVSGFADLPWPATGPRLPSTTKHRLGPTPPCGTA